MTSTVNQFLFGSSERSRHFADLLLKPAVMSIFAIAKANKCPTLVDSASSNLLQHCVQENIF